MDGFAAYVAGVGFRFIQPDTVLPPAEYNPVALALGEAGLSIEVLNTALPCDEAATRERLGPLCWMPRMSTFAIAAIINRGVAAMRPGQAFVNVGVWHGFTLLAGMVGNPDQICIGVDNFSEFGGPRDAFLARFRATCSPRHRFYEMDYGEYFARVHREPIGFYIYDGDHGYEQQLRGLQVAEPFFADGAIVLVDDTNCPEPRQGTLDFVARSRWEYRVLLDRTTTCNAHPTLWNGVMILQRTGRRS